MNLVEKKLRMPHLTGEKLKIIVIILIGWSSFAFADVITKLLSEDFKPAFILTFGGLFSGMGLVIWILFDRGWKGFLSPNWKWLIARGACIAVTATGVVNALALIPLADLYGITFSAPFISVVLAATILKEQVGWHRWLSVTVGFAGVIILLGPQFGVMNTGIAYAVAATLSIAIGTIIIRRIGKNEYLPLFILYPYVGILTVNAPIALPNLQIPPLPDIPWFMMNALLVLGGQLFVTHAVANAKSTASVAPFVYIQVIWGVAFGYFLFNEMPTFATITGLLLIVSAGLYMIYREKQLRQIAK